MDIIIRPMAAEDVPSVAAIGRSARELTASATDTFWSEDVLARWVESGDPMLVAEAEGKVVGFQLTQLHEPTKAGYLSDIAVQPEWRRHGIASRLIEAALDEFSQKGVEYVYGLTKVENEKIHILLKKFGFKRGHAFYWFEKYL